MVRIPSNISETLYTISSKVIITQLSICKSALVSLADVTHGVHSISTNGRILITADTQSITIEFMTSRSG